ncbi:hypothetical protein MRQ36_27120 [Micromonospora sp. R77]|uniref:hypothetical protein n=1 Tax=Micromonospora sp. R77 TaxID=2925836 RepID=UPI001F611AFA|nr:hypothetical protein [Micromonospora sp. R77]MCI4066022.1 hypothetical protein [Micromonospora sp. R77]
MTARLITDLLGQVIDGFETQSAEPRAVISVEATVEDYLPTTLKRFLALDPSQLDVPRMGEQTPAESLQDQLESLLDSAAELLGAARAQDVDALITQGNFLRTKFSRSDLEL